MIQKFQICLARLSQWVKGRFYAGSGSCSLNCTAKLDEWRSTMHFGVWKTRRTMLPAILGLVLASIPAFPQLQSGRIVGNVYDPQHATVSNATVTVTNAATNLSKTLST